MGYNPNGYPNPYEKGNQKRNNSSNYNSRSYNQGNRQREQYTPKAYQAEPVPANYVDEADNVMQEIKKKPSNLQITTSKLRNLFTLVMDVFNAEQLRTEEKLTSNSLAKIQRMRIRIVYEAGREKSTEEFVNKAKLIEYIKDIGDNREKLIKFAHYMEALVAYHRFHHVGNEK
jgi:CRISPR-associated protein Csm2